MKIKINSETCKKCKRCCKGTPGLIMAVRDDPRKSPKVNHDGKCEFLNKINKCKHLPKPFDCNFYPFYFLEDGIYLDKSCPEWKSALSQFQAYISRFKKDDIIKQGEYEKIWQPL